MITTRIEVLFTPADFAGLAGRDLSEATCVVFDVLRATSTMVTALAHGARAILPVAEIAEAVALWRERPDLLLAGERDGLRIPATLSGGVEFHLGNSPGEFTRERVAGRTVVMTTTNGTRALRACRGARSVLLGAFLNLEAVAREMLREPPAELLLVCAGTLSEAAYEDVLAAGALCDRVWPAYHGGSVADSALMARQLYQVAQADLLAAASQSRNARRLLARPELAADVALCLELGGGGWLAWLQPDGTVRAEPRSATSGPVTAASPFPAAGPR